jgi:thymidine phosphorylase
VNLDNSKITKVLRQANCVIAAAGPGLAPADRRLYALRDVTGTVESIPLIASSIMSKKIAEGTDALVLDVKTGSGAFMRDRDRAVEMARTMVVLGEEHGVRTRALVTRMDAPLGRAVGNALEVAESVRALQGDGPADLMAVTLALAREMLDLAGVHPDDNPQADPAEAISSGRAYRAWEVMVRAQGGDPDAPLPRATHVETALPAPEDGFLTRLDALAIGIAAWRLGAGRARKEDAVDHAAGVLCLAKPGDYVRRGQPIVELHGDERVRSDYVLEALSSAVTVGREPPAERAVIIDQIGARGTEGE